MLPCLYPRPDMLEFLLMSPIIRIVLLVLAALPILLACILLNRLIFNSADMINGAING